MIDLIEESRDSWLSADWFFALLVNALLKAHRFRIVSGAPDVEYGVEAEFAPPIRRL